MPINTAKYDKTNTHLKNENKGNRHSINYIYEIKQKKALLF